MMPGTLNLTLYQGATFQRVLKLTDANGPVNLTGATVRMQVRQTVGAGAVLLALTEANGRALITNTVEGEITLKMFATDTAALTFASGVYDLEIEYADGTVDRLLEGKLRVSPEVTR